MNRKIYFTAAILLATSMFLAACGGLPGAASQSEPTPLPPSIASTSVIVQGNLVPRETVDLAFAASGQLDEVLAEKGEQVKKGDVIARLGDREQYESKVAAAELELLSAKEELNNAEEALNKLNDDLPDNQTKALQTLTDAREQVRSAQRKLDGWTSQAKQLDIDAAEASMILARDRLDKARDDYKPYEKKNEDNLIRAALLAKLAERQKEYDDAVRKYNNLSGIIGNDFDVAQARSELEIAQSRLKIAQEDYDTLSKGPDPFDVTQAQSRIDVANGRITSAEAGVAAAKAALENLDLVATIDGTVTDNDLVVGQQISAGTPVVTLADFSQWYVDTDDLTEIDVVNIQPGQNATLKFDAIPDLTLNAVVERINERFEEKRGDITYTTRLRLEDVDQRLRWGMTAEVDFEE
jgi:HlyD family secretion protein